MGREILAQRPTPPSLSGTAARLQCFRGCRRQYALRPFKYLGQRSCAATQAAGLAVAGSKPIDEHDADCNPGAPVLEDRAALRNSFPVSRRLWPVEFTAAD
jgi:hypothetical protein